MDFYEKMPADELIAFYEENKKNIEKGIISKNMYYELGLMISVATKRGISLGKPCDFDMVVNQQALDEFIDSARKFNVNNDDPFFACEI